MKPEGVPRYRMLYELLRKHITDGLYREGDLLPSENELCTLHNMTRPTVRRALDALVSDGYIKKHQGRGSIVNALPKGIGILSIAGTTSVIGGDKLTTTMVVRPELRQWPEDFFFALNERERESGCIYMERLRFVSGEPVFYDINFLPNLNLPRFLQRNFENRSLFDTLRQYYGIEVRGGEQRIKALNADERIAGFFRVQAGAPVLYLERKLDTNRAGFSFYSAIYCDTEKHSLYGAF